MGKSQSEEAGADMNSALFLLRKPPFVTGREEAAAIDQRIALWRLRASLGDKNRNKVINFRLARLITDGMRYAANLRANGS